MYTYAYVQDNNILCLSHCMCTYGIEYVLYNQMLIVLD